MSAGGGRSCVAARSLTCYTSAMSDSDLLAEAKRIVERLYFEKPWENSGQRGVVLLRADDGRGADPDELALWKLFHPTSAAE